MRLSEIDQASREAWRKLAKVYYYKAGDFIPANVARLVFDTGAEYPIRADVPLKVYCRDGKIAFLALDRCDTIVTIECGGEENAHGLIISDVFGTSSALFDAGMGSTARAAIRLRDIADDPEPTGYGILDAGKGLT